MYSLKKTASYTTDGSSFSFVRDILGYREGKVRPVGSAPSSIGIATHAKSLHGKHININIIEVAEQSASTRAAIDGAVHFARTTFLQAEIGIGRVTYFRLSKADGDDYETITSNWEFYRLVCRFGATQHNGPDAFMVSQFNLGVEKDTIGKSPVPGLCTKKLRVPTGFVVSQTNMTKESVARTFSHELGHFLGCYHQNGQPDNLMCQSGDVRDAGKTPVLSIELTARQIRVMRRHCAVQDGI